MDEEFATFALIQSNLGKSNLTTFVGLLGHLRLKSLKKTRNR